MQILSKEQNDTLIIFLIGELDESTSLYTRNSLDRLLTASRLGKVVLDCSGLEFMDSTGIGVFLGRYKKMRDQSTPIYIAHAKNSVDRVLNLSGLYNIMPKIS